MAPFARKVHPWAPRVPCPSIFNRWYAVWYLSVGWKLVIFDNLWKIAIWVEHNFWQLTLCQLGERGIRRGWGNRILPRTVLHCFYGSPIGTSSTVA